MMTAGRNSGPAPSDRNPWEATATDEDDLRRKLRLYAFHTASAGNGRLAGGRIVITRPISFSAPVYLDSPGLLLEASGRFANTTREQLDALFEIRASHVTIRGIYLDGRTSALEPLIFARTTVLDPTIAPFMTLIDSCTFFGRRLYVDGTTGSAQSTRILNNFQGSYLGTHAASIAEDGLRAFICGNEVANGGSAAITVGANGGYARITHNTCLGAGIDTSASAISLNVIEGNTDAGTISFAVGDATGVNT